MLPQALYRVHWIDLISKLCFLGRLSVDLLRHGVTLDHEAELALRKRLSANFLQVISKHELLVVADTCAVDTH